VKYPVERTDSIFKPTADADLTCCFGRPISGLGLITKPSR